MTAKPKPVVHAHPDMLDWWRTFQKTPEGRAALRTFAAKWPSDTETGAILIVRTMRACFEAHRYAAGKDPGPSYRVRIRQSRASLPELRRAARLLATKRTDPAVRWAALLSGLDLAALGRFDAALHDRLPEVHGGPFLQRFTVGNLHFERPIASGRPIGADTMLAFELVMLLRLGTAGRASDALQAGQTMPPDGQPCYGIAAAFVAATLGSGIDAAQLAGRLRKLPRDVGLMPWPDPE